MKANVGLIDRVARVILGLGLLAFYFLNQGPYHWLGLIGIVPLVTAVMGWCPAYRLLGMSTCPVKRA